MPLLYHPSAGEVLLCHFDRGAPPPEMIKTRPVVVFGPRLRRRGRLVSVVPLSTTAPKPPENYHCEIILQRPLPPPFDTRAMWAKCDMLCPVSLDRLDRFREPRNRYGGVRKWTSGRLEAEQLEQVAAAVRAAFGFAD